MATDKAKGFLTGFASHVVALIALAAWAYFAARESAGLFVYFYPSFVGLAQWVFLVPVMIVCQAFGWGGVAKWVFRFGTLVLVANVLVWLVIVGLAG